MLLRALAAFMELWRVERRLLILVECGEDEVEVGAGGSEAACGVVRAIHSAEGVSREGVRVEEMLDG